MAQLPAIEIRAREGQLLGMPAARFLRDYWQKQPLLIRGAFAGMENPVAPDDLAGLACEDFALSRLVIHDPRTDSWTLRSGPFAEADFKALAPSHWTLLVQDVDKWDADVAALLRHFNFLPSWRVDDIMVSYAEDGGSVGAHVDQYDVFLLQGQGRRHWRISIDPDAPKTFREDVELKLLDEFSPTHEWLLEPGDMLYLPPGIPHHGVAQGACLTFSIGMRAPALGELVADFAGFMAERMPEELRYTDAGLAPAKAAGAIDDAAIEKIGQMLRDALAVDASTLRSWFGSFITRYRASNEAVPRSKPMSHVDFTRRLAAGAYLEFNPWTRIAWTQAPGAALLFVAGEQHRCTRELAERLCRREPLAAADLKKFDAASLTLILGLVNAGHLALTRSRSPS